MLLYIYILRTTSIKRIGKHYLNNMKQENEDE